MLRLSKRLVAEAVGTALLLTAIVGSGIMGERLASGNVAIALLANSIATGGALACLITALGPISGAHFNPVISLADAVRGGLSWSDNVRTFRHYLTARGTSADLRLSRAAQFPAAV